MSSDLWDAPIDEPQPLADRPAELDSERVIAANVMDRPELIDEIAAEFDPADITTDWYRWVWHAVDEIRQTLTTGDIRWQSVHRQLAAWKASGYLPIPCPSEAQLADLYRCATPGTTGWHADKVTKAAEASRLIAHGHNCVARGRSAAFDRDEDIPAAQAELDGVVRSGEQAELSTIGDLLGDSLVRAVTKPTKEDRIPTGFLDLDSLLCGGWSPGQLVVVGARPAMGKTTIGQDFVRAAAIEHGIPTLIESLEMGKPELSDRILSAEARIAHHHLKAGIATDDDMARAARRAPAIAAAPLYISDSPILSMPVLRGRVRHLVRTAGLRLVVVDYLQLMQAPKAENRQQAVAELSRGLKLLAKEFGITVVILCQLNRGPEQRTEKKPLVSDLRESGAIEQDADIVILLHREDAYEKESPRAGEADLIVGKHRGGPTGTITCAFQGHYSRFVDMAQT
ncbi:replicative DNA helicase [Streptomyces sp. NPDC038707]|uniref:replicative DNA helicase n=1 Tax=Streptomyces sp. NPDC038707 TaxID=3154329 RepID=UPI00340C32B2